MRIIRLNKEAVGSPKIAPIPAPWKGWDQIIQAVFVGSARGGGYIYGRGAIDIKGMLAKQLTLSLYFARGARQSGQRWHRDLLFLSVADGEHYRAAWIAEYEPDLFAVAGFALNEGGGFAVELGR